MSDEDETDVERLLTQIMAAGSDLENAWYYHTSPETTEEIETIAAYALQRAKGKPLAGEDHVRIGEALSEAIAEKPVRVYYRGRTMPVHAAYIHPDWRVDHAEDLIRALGRYGYEIRKAGS